MQKSILMAALVLTMALLPSFAAADSASYDLELGEFVILTLSGGPLDVPELSDDDGRAVIAGMAWLPTENEWTVNVLCVVPEDGHCSGDVSN